MPRAANRRWLPAGMFRTWRPAARGRAAHTPAAGTPADTAADTAAVRMAVAHTAAAGAGTAWLLRMAVAVVAATAFAATAATVKAAASAASPAAAPATGSVPAVSARTGSVAQRPVRLWPRSAARWSGSWASLRSARQTPSLRRQPRRPGMRAPARTHRRVPSARAAGAMGQAPAGPSPARPSRAPRVRRRGFGGHGLGIGCRWLRLHRRRRLGHSRVVHLLRRGRHFRLSWHLGFGRNPGVRPPSRVRPPSQVSPGPALLGGCQISRGPFGLRVGRLFVFRLLEATSATHFKAKPAQ